MLTCPICFETKPNLLELAVGQPCSHEFCSQCLYTWMASTAENSCPICRSRIQLVTASILCSTDYRVYTTQYFLDFFGQLPDESKYYLARRRIYCFSVECVNESELESRSSMSPEWFKSGAWMNRLGQWLDREISVVLRGAPLSVRSMFRSIVVLYVSECGFSTDFYHPLVKELDAIAGAARVTIFLRELSLALRVPYNMDTLDRLLEYRPIRDFILD